MIPFHLILVYLNMTLGTIEFSSITQTMGLSYPLSISNSSLLRRSSLKTVSSPVGVGVRTTPGDTPEGSDTMTGGGTKNQTKIEEGKMCLVILCRSKTISKNIYKKKNCRTFFIRGDTIIV